MNPDKKTPAINLPGFSFIKYGSPIILILVNWHYFYNIELNLLNT